ncbi:MULTISPECIES: NUDIX hydrolase [unclassified Modestobacter]|uniref:NUDIX hydrolase n=1 Tax=unclassified Modestobacter TaxID=2643866 RepID=UPI0022AAD0A5|nr:MULTISPECIES: NUDIX domain-containing protein [unclassified Modestobacter]MCZ2824050.1 NUDIX domain-containing protein [Modestobacter sp. VKM Ac-2981]MCZ2852295.1 NUDIX domain-containing protein [Modestobacter sp. VKM Ac-2982]
MRTLAEDDRLIAAAGGVVWRTGDGGALETAVVHRPKYDDWSLPKGKLDAGEHPLVAAVREVGEETGLQVVVGRRSVQTRYETRHGPKRVDYWVMEAVGGEFAANDEVDELRWLPVSTAVELVTHSHDRAVLEDLARTDVPRPPRVLLVRHASAGDRSAWDGPDDQRPLDRRGRAQAATLAAVLPVFGPARLLSAPPVRCGQTLDPLARELGMTVGSVPELGEEGFDADPQAGVELVTGLLADADAVGPVVICSQGGAIPAVLLALGARWHGTAGALWPPSAKGSVWALGGRPGALVADYYRDFSADPAAPAGTLTPSTAGRG